MIHIYHYNNLIDLTALQGNLGNTTMFNDKIKLFKGLDNKIHFKIRNTDRVTQTPNNVVFTLLDSNKVILLQSYLDFDENDKKYTLSITNQQLTDVTPSKAFYFTLSYRNDSDNGSMPLFVDHNFEIHGKVEVIAAHTPINIDEYNKFKEVDYKDLVDFVDEDHTFLLNERFNVDEKHIKFTFTSILPVKLLVFKHKGKFFPVDPEEMKQWEPYEVYYNVSHKDILGLPKGHYMFVVGSETISTNVVLFRYYII